MPMDATNNMAIGFSLGAQSLLFGLNVIATLLLLDFVRTNFIQPKTHTYIGNDYPIELPLEESMSFVGMTLHETVHYGLNLSDPIVEGEWTSLMQYPRGFGRVHLSPEHRVFNLVFWHQQHCVREMERAIQDRNHPVATPEHIKHCLNYLRQTFLCEADHTLEAGDFMARDFERDRIGETRICRDWEMVEQVLQQKMLEFFDWKHHNDLTH